MLETYFVKSQTVGRIRACWIGAEIERYAGWLAEQGYSPGRCGAMSRRWWRSGSSLAGAAPRPWRTCPLTSMISSPCGWPHTAAAGMPLLRSAGRSSRC